MNRRALIVIDFQNDYFAGGKFPLKGTEIAAAKAAHLLEASRKRGDLIVHVRHESTEADASFFVPGSRGAEIHALVAPIASEPVLVKNAINAFNGTSLKSILDAEGIRELVIVGAMSHMCIDAATRAAADHGFAVTVVHDAVATRDLQFGDLTVSAADVHAAFMAAIAFGYANVTSASEMLSGAGGQASLP